MKRQLSWVVGVALIAGVSCKNAPNAVSENAANRSIGAPSESRMSEAMRQYRDRFIAMKSADDVDQLFNDVAQQLESGALKDADIKLVAAQILPLTKLRGIYWRLAPTVENSGSNTFHSLIGTFLMQMATGARLLAPDASLANPSPWQAINHYFLYPYQGVGNQFTKISAFQDFSVLEVVPLISKAIQAVEGVHIDPRSPVVWDNQLIFGKGSFGNDTDLKDRYVTVYEAERLMLLSMLQLIRHNTLFFAEYDYEEFPELVNKMGMLVGFQQFLFGSANGMAAKDRADVLCPSRDGNKNCTGKFAKLFTRRRTDNGNMTVAYKDLLASADNMAAAWSEIKRRDQKAYNDFQLLDPQKILPWARINDLSVSNMQALLKGQPVRSAVSGRVIRVNYPAFYNNPPSDMKNFIPLTFDSQPRRFDIGGQKDVRNYEYGYSLTWDPAIYAPYFPDVKQGTEVPLILKDLAQTWGGWVAGLPLTTMSMVF